MELFDIYKSLVKETFLFRNYKRMHIAKAILSAIVVLPFTFVYTLLMLSYGAILIFLKLIDSPTEYLITFLKKEGSDVKHATQAVMYFIAFPTIFVLKIFMSIAMFALFVIHFFASIFGYFATLGGITFSPFILDPVDRERHGYDTSEYNITISTVFVTAGMILFWLAYIIAPMIMENAGSYSAYESGMVMRSISAILNFIFVIVYVLIFFRNKNTEKLAKAETKPESEATAEAVKDEAE